MNWKRVKQFHGQEVDIWERFGTLVSLWSHTLEPNRFTIQVLNKKVMNNLKAGKYGALPEDEMALQAFYWRKSERRG